MIVTNNGGMYSRAELKSFAQVLFAQIIRHNYNKNAISDLYNTIWHCDITPDSSLTRIIVMPPLEVREKCDKIARRRKNSRQKELDIEATIMEWCAENNVTPRHAVYTNRPAVLFFNDDFGTRYGEDSPERFRIDLRSEEALPGRFLRWKAADGSIMVRCCHRRRRFTSRSLVGDGPLDTNQRTSG